jgi:hypothetical protein
MRKILDLSSPAAEKLLIAMIDAYLKANGFAGHTDVSTLLSFVKTEEPKEV